MLIRSTKLTVRAEQPEMRPGMFIPTVYERVQDDVVRWEYHIEQVDTREQPLPEAERFNELGKEGWILAGLLDERATGKGAFVYYYFTRRA